MDYDYNNMNNSGVVLTKKKILLLAGMVVLVIAGVVIWVMVRRGPSQNMPESSEPQLDFVAEGSKIAGIQVLVTDAGLSREQYVAVYKKLNKELVAQEPDASYFRLVEGSLSLVVSGKSTGSSGVPLVEGLSTEDNTETEPEPDFLREDKDEDKDEESAGAFEEDLAHDTVVFVMRSESGAEYTVEVYTAGGVDRADTTITRK